MTIATDVTKASKVVSLVKADDDDVLKDAFGLCSVFVESMIVLTVE